MRPLCQDKLQVGSKSARSPISFNDKMLNASVAALVLLLVLAAVFGPYIDAQMNFSPLTRRMLEKGFSAAVTGGFAGLIVSIVRLIRRKRQARAGLGEPKPQDSGAVWKWDGSKWIRGE